MATSDKVIMQNLSAELTEVWEIMRAVKVRYIEATEKKERAHYSMVIDELTKQHMEIWRRLKDVELKAERSCF